MRVPSTAFDSFYLRDRYASPAMRAIWDDRRMIQRWLDNPDSVDPTWRAFFQGFTLGSNGSSPQKPGMRVFVRTD